MIALRKITETMDMHIKEMGNLAVLISLDYIITYHSFVDDGYSRGKCVEELSKYKSSNMFLHDILLYNKRKNSEKMYTTSGVYDLDLLSSNIYKDYWNKNDFLRTIDEIEMPYMRPSESVTDSKLQGNDFTTYVFPLPINSFHHSGAVLFLIRRSALDSMVSDALKEYNGCTYIFDEKNNPIFVHVSGQEKDPYFNVLNEKEAELLAPGIQNIEVDHINYLVTKSISEYNGWSYVTLMNTDQVLRKVSEAKKVLTMGMFGLFMLGSVIAFAFSLKQYKNLIALVNIIKRKEPQFNIPSTAEKDEVAFISRSIEYMADENSRLSLQLKDSMKEVRNEILISLLKGNEKDELIQAEMYQMMGIKIEEGYYVTVLLFRMDHYKDYIDQKGSNNRELTKINIINIMEETSEEMGKGYCVDLMGKGQFGLILCTAIELGPEIAIQKLVTNIKSYFNVNYEVTFTVGIGQTYDKLYRIKDSFEEALRASTYRLIYGRNKTIFYKEICCDTNGFFKYASSIKNNFKIAVKKADYIEAEQIIDEIIDHMSDSRMTPEQIFCIYYGMINSLINTIEEFRLDIEDNEFGLDAYMVNENFEVIDDLRKALKDLSLKICQMVQTQRNSMDEKLADGIIRFINKNFADNTLSSIRIAETFGVSVSHCNKIFKGCTGDTVMEYVDKLRLVKAKELLTNSDDKLQDILDKTGYVDKVNFIRKFKKKEGMTPIQYRSVFRRSDTKSNC